MLFKYFKNPIAKNFIAQLYGIGARMVEQIFLIPFFISFWGVERYGDWIILTAISSFFTMSNVGLNSATANCFAIAYAQEKYKECQTLLANNYILLFVISFIAILGTFFFVNSFNIVKILGLHVIPRFSANMVFVILIIEVFLLMYTGLLNSIYRARSLASRGTFLDRTAMLLSSISIILGLYLHLSFECIVLVKIFPTCILLCFKYWDTKRLFKYRISLSLFDKKKFKDLVLPSLSFMCFPIGGSILFQGFTLVVNRFYGVNMMVLFNTTRTMVNFVKSLVNTINFSVEPEFSLAYGKKDYLRMRRIHRYSISLSSVLCLCVTFVLLLLGQYIYEIWTKGQIEFNQSLMFVFMIVVLFDNLWTTSSVTLKATNNHTKLGIFYLLSTIFSIILAIGVTKIYTSITITVLCILVVSVALTLYVFKKSLILTKDSVMEIRRDVITWFKIRKTC